MHLGLTGLYQPKWTDRIQQEWQRNLLIQRPDIRAERLRRKEALMNQAFPDARIVDYEDLIEGLRLPGSGDRHVLAAAIRSGGCDHCYGKSERFSARTSGYIWH